MKISHQFSNRIFTAISTIHIHNMRLIIELYLRLENYSFYSWQGAAWYLEIAKLGKQVFIALDKTQSYGPETDRDLNKNQVLYLSEGGDKVQ